MEAKKLDDEYSNNIQDKEGIVSAINGSIISVKQLSKTYSKKKVVNSLDLTIYRGETTVIMGPNGAGKTTFMEMLSGLKTPDSGSEIKILGLDIVKNPEAHLEKIGVQLQETLLFERATAKDYLDFFLSIYRNVGDVDEIIHWLGLDGFLDKQIKDLSGGMAQRVALALALINDPDLVMLDEPTVGLDPIARRELWAFLKSLKNKKKTLLFTTHYMDEAVSLADRIIMMSNGQVVFNGSPREVQETATQLNCDLDEIFEYYVTKKQDTKNV